MKKRRWIAGILAAVLAAAPVLGASSEELVENSAEIILDVSEEDLENAAAKADASIEAECMNGLLEENEAETNAEEQFELQEEEFLIEMEPVETAPMQLDIEEAVVQTAPMILSGQEEELISGTVQASGRAEDAGLPRLRTYAQTTYTTSYGEQLEGSAKKLYDGMVDQFVRKKETGDLEIVLEKVLQYDQASQEEYTEVKIEINYIAQSAFDAFKYDYPEVFWFGDMSYGGSGTRSTGNGKTINRITKIKISPMENYPGASSAEERSTFEAAVSEAVRQISGRLSAESTRRDQVRAIHDYLCEQVTYDHNYASYGENDVRLAYIHSAAGVFLKGGSAVCEGYAKAFKILCAKFGIESALIAGDALGEGHMWNYVKMEDGHWSLVDVTWDDQVKISDRYFLVGSQDRNASGKTIESERQIYSKFSLSAYTKDFAVPILSDHAYQASGGAGNTPDSTPVPGLCTHDWQLDELHSKEATCKEGGYSSSCCSKCGATTKTMPDKKPHSFLKAPVYNQDATYQADGTKTYYCDYGCGTKGDTVVAKGTRLIPTYEINAKSLRLKIGQKTTKFKITKLGEDDYVESWTSSKKSVVSVTGKKNGTCTIKAKKKGTAVITAVLHSGVTIEIPVKVQKKAVQATTIKNVPEKLVIQKGKTEKISPKLGPITCKKTVTFRSKNKKIASVTKNGKIRAKKKGKTEIIVSCGSLRVRCNVIVE